MEPAILEIAGFVVFNRQHTKFTKMPKKFVALSVALCRLELLPNLPQKVNALVRSISIK